MILNRNIYALNNVPYRLQTEAFSIALGNHRNKINFMRLIKICINNTNKLILNDIPHEDISCFQYGIFLVTNISDIMVEIKEIITSLTLAYDHMITYRKQYLSKKIKIKIHKTVPKSILQYGTDT